MNACSAWASPRVIESESARRAHARAVRMFACDLVKISLAAPITNMSRDFVLVSPHVFAMLNCVQNINGCYF